MKILTMYNDLACSRCIWMDFDKFMSIPPTSNPDTIRVNYSYSVYDNFMCYDSTLTIFDEQPCVIDPFA